jgi:hypothetical protein
MAHTPSTDELLRARRTHFFMMKNASSTIELVSAPSSRVSSDTACKGWRIGVVSKYSYSIIVIFPRLHFFMMKNALSTIELVSAPSSSVSTDTACNGREQSTVIYS